MANTFAADRSSTILGTPKQTEKKNKTQLKANKKNNNNNNSNSYEQLPKTKIIKSKNSTTKKRRS